MNSSSSVQQGSIGGHQVHPTNLFVAFRKKDIEQSIPDRFEQISRRFPDHYAVKTRNHQFTYDALNQVSNRIARTILAQCGKAKEPIALLFEHDASAMAAILGILKAGRIYIPLDPSYPVDRTIHILEDSQASIIVTNNKNLSLACELAQDAVKLINIDKMDLDLSTANLGLPISPDAPAYIIYTSGTTGRPKGFTQSHRNVLHTTMVYTNSIKICAADRLVLLYSHTVSGAVRDIFGALLNGATLFPFDIKQEGLTNLGIWLIQEEITIYNSVATIFRHFVSSLIEGERFPKLRMINLGSETIYNRDVELYKKHFSQDCIFVARYGATETGPIRQYVVDKETQITGSIVPAGYAVDDIEVLLLDDEGKEVGLNQIGEIAVRSRYLSPGYWRRPDLTEAAFLPDPEGGDKRIYRTGDLGRMLPDGCLLHLGRKDFQVKIRGHRVEVYEVEMALLDLDAIKEVAVVAQEYRQGDKRLVAYFVVDREPGPTISKLWNFLRKKLPEYMVPAAFVQLSALPLTPTGKVDRRALSAPDMTRPDLETPIVAPRTPVEETLVSIWAEVLGLGQVGIYDNFFELGGNSLLATQIISRIRDAFHVELLLRTLFEAPTIANMAVMITQGQVEKAGQDRQVLPMPPASRDGHLSLSFAEEQLWQLGIAD